MENPAGEEWKSKYAVSNCLLKEKVWQNFSCCRISEWADQLCFFVFSDMCCNLFDLSWALTLSNLVKSFAVFQADPGLPYWEFFAPLLYTLPPPLCSYCAACRIVAWYIHIWLWEIEANFLRIVSCQRPLLILCAQLVPPGRQQGLAQVVTFFLPLQSSFHTGSTLTSPAWATMSGGQAMPSRTTCTPTLSQMSRWTRKKLRLSTRLSGDGSGTLSLFSAWSKEPPPGSSCLLSINALLTTLANLAKHALALVKQELGSLQHNSHGMDWSNSDSTGSFLIPLEPAGTDRIKPNSLHGSQFDQTILDWTNTVTHIGGWVKIRKSLSPLRLVPQSHNTETERAYFWRSSRKRNLT